MKLQTTEYKQFILDMLYLYFSKVQQVVAQLEDTKSPQVVDEIFQIPWGHNIVI